jgi:hypothetical protein
MSPLNGYFALLVTTAFLGGLITFFATGSELEVLIVVALTCGLLLAIWVLLRIRERR